MGQTKRMYEEREHKKDMATEVAISAGVLRRCLVCSDITKQDGDDYTRAYAVANKMVTNQDPLVEIFKGDRRELTDMIKEAIDDAGIECYCQSKMRDDS